MNPSSMYDVAEYVRDRRVKYKMWEIFNFVLFEVIVKNDFIHYKI